jgi:two-component system, OmpR family, sensor histidine kinase KdpD
MNGAALPQRSRNSARGWLLVALLLAAATACGFLLDHYVSLLSQAMIYVLAVVIASYKLDWVESAVCAVGAVTALNFFFVPPRWTFEVESQEHFIALLSMLVLALVISHLATGLRRESQTARRNEQRARQLQGLAVDLSTVTTPQQVQQLGETALEAAFAGPCALALADDQGELSPTDGLDTSLRDGMRCCMKEGAVLGPGTGRWPGLEAWYLPLGDKDRVAGAACVRPAPAADTGGREHAQALCSLLAQALWRLRLTSSMLAAQSEAQHQQLQSTFLAAISHDLRTPLAAIVGAASSLQTQRDKLSLSEQERLLGSIVSEAAYLSTVTENTLQLVRLASPAQELRRDWESMEEIVGTVLARVRARDPARRIKSSVAKDLPLVKADPVLLAQLIANLLDNALKYSADTIDLSVAYDALALVVAVKDRGPGIPEEERARLFEPYARGDRSAQRGVGLGLAVCQAIARAHGGQLTYRPRAGGGSSFVLTLPVEAQQTAPESP